MKTTGANQVNTRPKWDRKASRRNARQTSSRNRTVPVFEKDAFHCPEGFCQMSRDLTI